MMKTNPTSSKRRSTLFDIPEHTGSTFDMDDSIVGSTNSSSSSSCLEEQPSPNTSLFRKFSRRWTKKSSSSEQGYRGGANVPALRGIYGSDFEGYAVVCLGRSSSASISKRSSLGFSDPKERFLLIKGSFCFVFKDEQSPAPKYVIRLGLLPAHHTKKMTRVTNVTRHMTTVIMTTSQDQAAGCEHKFVFLREAHAKNFCATVNRIALQGEMEEIQQTLGKNEEQQQLILTNSKSIRYAESLAMETMDVDKEHKVLRGKMTNNNIIRQRDLRTIGASYATFASN